MANAIIPTTTVAQSKTARLDQYPPYYARLSQVYETQYSFVTSARTPRVTVDFRKRLKMGSRIKPLAYSINQNSSTMNWGTNTMFYNGGIASVETRNITLPAAVPDRVLSTTPSLEARAYNLAVNALRVKLKDSKANFVQAYAESSQVHRLIGDVTKTLANVYVNLRKGNLAAAGKTLGLKIGKRRQTRYRQQHARIKTNDDIDKMLSNGVLAVQYGIKPLISDVIGAAELYAQKTCEEVINRCTISKTLWVKERYVAKGQTSQGTVRRYGMHDGYVRVQLGCTFAKGDETTHTLKQMGFTNPLLIAWELLPWSFVIDWFIPIGNYISSLDATLGLTFRDGYVSTKVDLVTQVDQVLTPEGGYNTFLWNGSSVSKSYERNFTRTIMSGFPSSRLPVFKNPFSWEHAVNGIALLTGFKKTAYIR